MIDTLFPVLLYNVLGASLIIAAANLFRIGWYPLDYLPVLFHWTLFGLLQGSGSFEAAARTKAVPSLDTLIGSGFIEITAYTFIAAATAGLYVYRQNTLLTLKAEKVRNWSEITVPGCSRLTIAVAVLLIVAAGYRESLSILST